MTFYALSISFFQHVTCCTCSLLDLQLLWLFSWECCYTLSENISVKKVDWYITCQCRSSLRTTLHRLVYCFFLNFLLNILFQWFCLQSQVYRRKRILYRMCNKCCPCPANNTLFDQAELSEHWMYVYFFFLFRLSRKNCQISHCSLAYLQQNLQHYTRTSETTRY